MGKLCNLKLKAKIKKLFDEKYYFIFIPWFTVQKRYIIDEKLKVWL